MLAEYILHNLFTNFRGGKKKAVISETGFVVPVLSPFLCSGFTLEIFSVC
jgi:hypothetical protein